jgi:hypothetical protein
MTTTVAIPALSSRRRARWLPAVMVVTLALGLAGCGDDGYLKDTIDHTTKANAAMDADDFPTAINEWQSGMAVVGAHRDIALAHGTLGDRGDELTKRFQQRIHNRLSHLEEVAGKSRATLAAVTAFVQACAAPADQTAWAATSADLTQGFQDGEAQAADAAKSGAYLLWAECGSDGANAQGWVQGDLVNLLKNDLGANVVSVTNQPGAQDGIGSVHLVLVWSEAQYESSADIGKPVPGAGHAGYTLPQAVTATMTIASHGGSKHDGTHTWKVFQPAPAQTGDLITARGEAVSMLLNKLAGAIQATEGQ